MASHRTPRKPKIAAATEAPIALGENAPTLVPAKTGPLTIGSSNSADTEKPAVKRGAPAAEVQSPSTSETQRGPVETPLSAWQICGEAVTGLAHRRKGLPCQDAVTWRSPTRPILALSDGAGSAAVSELGAAALVGGVSRFLVSMEDVLSPWLDCAAGKGEEQAARWSERLLAHALGLLEDLAHIERRNVRDLRATLLLAVVGTVHSFWWQVGDGAIVVRSTNGLRTIGDTSKTKGEFANQTCFVDTAGRTDVQFGLLPTSEIFGVALLSDGGAEKLVAHDGSRVAPRIGKWFDAVAQRSFSPDKIALAFHEPEMWERTSLDDRSVVLAARTEVPDPTSVS